MELVESLKNKRNAHAEGFADGVVKAAEFLLHKSLDIVPMDTGYLASTARIVKTGSGFEKKARVIFSAKYSIWVHERLDLAHGRAFNIKHAEDIAMGRTHMRRPQEQAKFLETPLRQFRKELVEIVRQEMAGRRRQSKITFNIIRGKGK